MDDPYCSALEGQNPESFNLFSYSTSAASKSASADSDPSRLADTGTPSSPSAASSPSEWLAHKPRLTVYRRLQYYSSPGFWRWILIILVLFLSLQTWLQLGRRNPFSYLPREWRHDEALKDILRPYETGQAERKNKHDPVRWLKQHSSPDGRRPGVFAPRPRAALISLVRNEELEGILQSMRQLEHHWNRNYGYPWIFFNEKPFSDEFKVCRSLFPSR